MDLDEIERFLAGSSITFKRIDPSTIALSLKGDARLSVTATIRAGAEALHIESFFMRAPQDNRDAFYELCLRRNARTRFLRYALDADGDVFLVGDLPLLSSSESTLDAALGELLVESDGMFQAAIETGFETYLAADMAWRASKAGPDA